MRVVDRHHEGGRRIGNGVAACRVAVVGGVFGVGITAAVAITFVDLLCGRKATSLKLKGEHSADDFKFKPRELLQLLVQ